MWLAYCLYLSFICRASSLHTHLSLRQFTAGLTGLTKHLGIATMAAVISTSGIRPANAFDNRMKAFDGPKTPGPAISPKVLGVSEDGLLKAACVKPSPNCFSTVLGVEDPNTGEQEYEHLLPMWSFDPSKLAPEKAFAVIDDTLRNYEVGQSGVDIGGFKIIKSSLTDKNYFTYMQFESFRRGYIDDLEIMADKSGNVQVFSSSRIGYLDKGVNMKRLNYISSKLRDKGFSAPRISFDTHPIYFELNQVSNN